MTRVAPSLFSLVRTIISLYHPIRQSHPLCKIVVQNLKVLQVVHRPGSADGIIMSQSTARWTKNYLASPFPGTRIWAWPFIDWTEHGGVLPGHTLSPWTIHSRRFFPLQKTAVTLVATPSRT